MYRSSLSRTGAAGLVELFSNDPTIEIVGQASTRGEAVERARRRAPGVSQLGAGDGQPAMRANRRGPRPGPGGRARSPGLDRLFSGEQAGAARGRALCASSTLATDNVVWTPAIGLDDYPAGLDGFADDPQAVAATGR